jgi:hypothetical protein
MKFMANAIESELSFVDFSDYYSKRSAIHNIANQQIASHRFDISGEIIPIIDDFSFIRFVLSHLPPVVLKYYRKLKTYFNSDLYMCGKKGLTICGVLKKQ